MYKLLIELLYSCGLRLSEALNIKYNDINHLEKSIYGKINSYIRNYMMVNKLNIT